MHKHWGKYPPIHITAALYLGLGKGEISPEVVAEKTQEYIEAQPTITIKRPK